MLRRYSKARSSASSSINGDLSNNIRPPSMDVYERRVQDLSKALEESQMNANQVRLKRKFLQVDLCLNKLIINRRFHPQIPR